MTLPPAAGPKKQFMSTRSFVFLIGLLVALAAFVFSVGPRSWFEPQTAEPEMPEIGEVPTNDPHTEIAMLEKMWQDHPDHAPIALQLGNLYYDDGQYNEAIKFYREFLKSDTSASGYEVRLDLARALFQLRRSDEAKGEIENLLKVHPDHPSALYNLGAMEANLGNFAAAKTAWERLIQTHPEDTLATFAKQSLPMLKLPPGHP